MAATATSAWLYLSQRNQISILVSNVVHSWWAADRSHRRIPVLPCRILA